jgi:toxin ParE1/3/4
MAEFRLTEVAETDHNGIYDGTLKTFGRYQADAYHSGFDRIFGLLAQFPRMGLSVEELKAGYRRFQFQLHYIFYTEESSYILIRAIYHTSNDVRQNLIR